MVGIDLFAGAGGMSLGAKQANIDIIYAVESCPHAARSYGLNFPKTPLFLGDIRSVKQLPPKPYGIPSILFGGPPCQGFSTSNQRTRTIHNSANWMFKEFIRLAKLWRPDWIVIENVKGILETAKGMFFSEILRTLEENDYKTSAAVLNAIDYGVPQNRSRTFIVGSYAGDSVSFPKPSTKRQITVGEAISDLPRLSSGASIDILPYRSSTPSKYASSLRRGRKEVSGNLVTRNAKEVLDRYPYVSQGGNWQDIPASLFANYKDFTRCHTGIYRRLHPERPSVVIGNFRKNMLIHPKEDRGLSIREAARIQSVPDHYAFSGSIGFQQQQVGNMVPPPLARSVFREICNK